jgi:malate dehydrogenase (oxaloacetate-decarboxylating)(NADP+)
MISKEHNIIIADTVSTELPTAKDLVEITLQTATLVKKMGYNPRVALLSFSNFGNPLRDKATRVREAVQMLDEMKVGFEYDGEMTADVALNMELRHLYPFCRLSGPANVLIMPGLHSSSISTQLLQELAGGVFIGPILDGFEYPVQIVQMGSTASDILKVSAFATINAINNKML